MLLLGIFVVNICSGKEYREIQKHTKNITAGRNELHGVVLHHTETSNISQSLLLLCNGKVSCHVVIDTDGTRYILAKPEAITWHAGYSILDQREKCNEFTIGIEFQGDTSFSPLTENQINSAIEYLLPIIRQYGIQMNYIVTHAMVRQAWKAKYPDLAEKLHVVDKVDITTDEYNRFMNALVDALNPIDGLSRIK